MKFSHSRSNPRASLAPVQLAPVQLAPVQLAPVLNGTGRAGMTMVELALSSSIFTLVLLTSLGSFSRSADLTRASAGVANTETRAQILLHGIEKELADAASTDPATTLTAALAAGTTTLAQVADTAGFPTGGRLLINRGTALTERCDYTGRALTG